jgi:predicted peroxiredoxin
MTTGTQRFAFLLETSIDATPQTVTSLGHAIELAEAGHEVEIFLDGAATKWPSHLNHNPGNPVKAVFEEAKGRGLVAGACGLCSVNFEAIDAVKAEGIDIYGDESTHGIDTPQLVADGFELIFVS